MLQRGRLSPRGAGRASLVIILCGSLVIRNNFHHSFTFSPRPPRPLVQYKVTIFQQALRGFRRCWPALHVRSVAGKVPQRSPKNKQASVYASRSSLLLLSGRLCDLRCDASMWFSHTGSHGAQWMPAWETSCMCQPWMPSPKIKKIAPLPYFFCLLGRVQISHSHNDTATIPAQSSVLHLKAYLTSHSSIHGPWALSLWARAKISFWQTMQWIKGHTWPLSCSLGDQTHFQGQELLTGLFNPQGEVGNSKEVYGNGFGIRTRLDKSFARWNKTDGR